MGVFVVYGIGWSCGKRMVDGMGVIGNGRMYG